MRRFRISSCGWVFPVLFFFACFQNQADVVERAEAQNCFDRIDNDADGKTDCNDDGCAEVCNIGLDSAVAPYRYTYGIQPTAVNYAQLQRYFQLWLNKHYEENEDRTLARVRFQADANQTDYQGRPYSTNHTVSEGIAYGMLITVAYDASPDRFNRLWAYYKRYKNDRGVMHWMTYLFEPEPAKYNGATDAELDAITALLIAHRKWGEPNGTDFYLQEAGILAQAVRTFEVDEQMHLKPGDAWNNYKNPGYAATGAMKFFAIAFNNGDWNTIVDSSYALIGRCQNPSNGLYPDWCKVDGSKANNGHEFYMDAVRMPWRLALDYWWHGSQQAAQLNNRFYQWLLSAHNLDLSRLKSGYMWADGSPWTNGTNTAGPASPMFIGAYCMLAAHTNNQDFMDRCYARLVESPSEGYFGQSLQLIFAATLAGLLQRPF